MAKVSEVNWSQLDFLINNFYEIIEFKRGRGIYGDRVILQRSKHSSAIFGEKDKFYEFYYMDAKPVVELTRTIFERIKVITRIVRSPDDMSVLCDYKGENAANPINWAVETTRQIADSKSLDYKVLNELLLKRYKLLDIQFISKLNKHREKQYFIASSESLDLIPKEHSNNQLAIM